ncbi:hypothetical protein ACHWQZ_G010299 [Mnemiopsis leidyi]
MSKKQSGSVKDESPLKQYSLMITSTDLMFQKISESLTATATSAAAARDKADSFNICLSEYSVKENRAIRGELVDYCECLKAVEDKKQQTIENITEKLKPACDRWKAICTEVQGTLKTLCAARDKEVKAVRTLEKTKCKEGSKKAEQVAGDLANKQTELAAKNAEILALMQQFHTQKLNDYKAILSTYAQIQMLYHSRSLEFYTRAFQDMLDIQEEEYLETVLNETTPISLSQSVPQNMDSSCPQSQEHLNMTK